MKKLFFIFLIALTFCITALVVYSQPKNTFNNALKWEKIAPGLEFVSFGYGKWFKKGNLYAIKIGEPRKLKILLDTERATSLKSLEEHFHPMVVINGSYFQENFIPAGLLKVNNKVISGLNKLGGSGILGINGNDFNIFHKNELNTYKQKYMDLMQNGPLLVEDNGKSGIYSDDHEYTARTTIGITKDNKLLIVVADMAASPSLWEIADLLTRGEVNGGFDSKITLNLDGGSSTGLRINLPDKKIIVEESALIANGLGIF
jgi:hypothetical protein